MKPLLLLFILTASLRADTPEEIAKRVVTSEEAVLKLTPALKKLAKQITEGLHTQSFPAQWKARLKEGSTWENASFGTLLGTFDDLNFVTKTKFEGLIKHPDGSLTGIKAKQKMTWKVKPNDQFSLLDWQPLTFEAVQAPRPLFQDVTTTAIPSADLPDMSSAYQYPSVCVVDYNSDGHDDLFITARYTEPQLFKNKGNGTFEDVTLESGLTPGHCVNFVLFADFDNDGDPDALVCRSLEPTLYYQNDNGRFENVTRKLSDLGEQFFQT